MMMMMMMMMTAIKQNRYKSNNKIRIFKLKAKREHHDKYKSNNRNNNINNNNNNKFFIYSQPFISSRLVSSRNPNHPTDIHYSILYSKNPLTNSFSFDLISVSLTAPTCHPKKKTNERTNTARIQGRC